jgi:hypothetical protein
MERVDQIALHVTKLARATGISPKDEKDATIDSLDGVTSGWLIARLGLDRLFFGFW